MGNVSGERKRDRDREEKDRGRKNDEKLLAGDSGIPAGRVGVLALVLIHGPSYTNPPTKLESQRKQEREIEREIQVRLS